MKSENKSRLRKLGRLRKLKMKSVLEMKLKNLKKNIMSLFKLLLSEIEGHHTG